ncbi:MAG TPA: molybdenum ABC transporter ATP-binding protein [Polyangiaceae bacterium]|nr:molybdenum ABC transporter ATP-binding protein [Polyangiaceae bacterium]
MSNSEPPDLAGIALSLRVVYSGFSLDAELSIAASGVTALFGTSGSGKTTCLRLLAGLERGRGTLHAFGECWQDDQRGLFIPTHQRAVGYVFQEASLFPHLNVRENLHYARVRKRPAGRAPSFDSVVALLGIEPLLRRTTDRLSGGERQRVAIARALLSAPRLLLMDEPLSALDEARKAELFPYLERLRRELSIPIVYVSHSLDEVARLADRLVLLDNGRVTAAGSPSELLSRLDLPFASGEQSGVVIETQVALHDDIDGLTRLDFEGGALWLSRLSLPVGSRARVRVLARDVSLAMNHPGPSSILNVLSGYVTALSDEGPSRVNVRLVVGTANTPLLACITRRSRDALGLAPGSAIHAQVKSVALT